MEAEDPELPDGPKPLRKGCVQAVRLLRVHHLHVAHDPVLGLRPGKVRQCARSAVHAPEHPVQQARLS